MPATLISPAIIKRYTMDGHPVSVECQPGHGADEPDPASIKCPDCALPYVLAQSVLLMAALNIRKMTVDGAVLARVA